MGPYYAHAEARKAPGLDGKVERDSHGKEVRYPVMLSSKEKMIARKVVLAFGVNLILFFSFTVPHLWAQLLAFFQSSINNFCVKILRICLSDSPGLFF